MRRTLYAALTLALTLALPASAADHGATLYADHCAACHGAALEGQPDWQTPNPDGTFPAPPHDATGHTWHHGDGLLTDYVRLGGQKALEMRGVTGFASGMPAFGEVLTDQDIAAVLDYIKSSWPPRVQEAQRARTAAEQGN